MAKRGKSHFKAVGAEQLEQIVEQAAQDTAERDRRDSREYRPGSTPAKPQTPEPSKIEPVFARRLLFGETTRDLLRVRIPSEMFPRRVLPKVDTLGYTDVELTGARSQRPDEGIALSGLRAYVNQDNIVVLSGKVQGNDVDEIGNGHRIRRTDAPTPDPDLVTPKWLHVALGTKPDAFDVSQLSSALRTDGSLELTPVIIINGRLSFPGDSERQQAWTRKPPID